MHSYPSRECKNSSQHGTDFLLHNHNDPLLGSAPNLLHPTGPHHGYQTNQLFQHPSGFTPHHPSLLHHPHSPNLRQDFGSLRSKTHWDPHRNHPLATSRCWIGPIQHFHGRRGISGSEAQRRSERPQYAGRNPCFAAIANQHILAIFSILHIRNR